MNKALNQALKYAEEIRKFPLGECGPSDDLDKQTAYLYGFRDLAKMFAFSAKRIGDPDLSEMISELNLIPDCITEAYDLRANLFGIIDYLENANSDENYQKDVSQNSAFLNPEVLEELASMENKKFDIKKLVKFCEELNDSYSRANYLACVLLIRAVMNHIPPIFNVEKFSQVVASSGKSIKAILAYLESQARPIADLHTHFLIREKEQIPTKDQVEPYKPSFEILIQEIIVKLTQNVG
jgi:hypothetical protein